MSTRKSLLSSLYIQGLRAPLAIFFRQEQLCFQVIKRNLYGRPQTWHIFMLCGAERASTGSSRLIFMYMCFLFDC